MFGSDVSVDPFETGALRRPAAFREPLATEGTRSQVRYTNLTKRRAIAEIDNWNAPDKTVPDGSREVSHA